MRRVLALGLAVFSKDAAGRQVFGGRYSRLRGGAGTTADAREISAGVLFSSRFRWPRA